MHLTPRSSYQASQGLTARWERRATPPRQGPANLPDEAVLRGEWLEGPGTAAEQARVRRPSAVFEAGHDAWQREALLLGAASRRTPAPAEPARLAARYRNAGVPAAGSLIDLRA